MPVTGALFEDIDNTVIVVLDVKTAPESIGVVRSKKVDRAAKIAPFLCTIFIKKHTSHVLCVSLARCLMISTTL